MHRTRLVFGITALFLTTGMTVSAQSGKGAKPAHTTAAPQTAARPVVPKPAKPAVAPAASKPAPPAASKTQAKAAKPPQAKATAATPVKPSQAKASPAKAVKPPQAKASAATKTAKPSQAKATPPAKPVKPAKVDAAARPKTTTPQTAAAVKPAKTAKAVKADPKKTAKADKPAAATTAKPAKAAERTSPAPPAGTLTPVQEKLTKNANLSAKLASRLPAGTDVMAASTGFKNLGQFVAAVNVSNNLNIPFTDLKTRMVTDHLSLGQAIQATRPRTASPTVEAQRAEYDARGMIAESERPAQPAAPAVEAPAKGKAKAKKAAQ